MDSSEASLRPDPFTAASPGTPKKRRPWLGILLIALLVVAVVLLVTHKPQPKPDESALNQPAVVTIKAATVREGDIGIHVDALGTVTPISTVSLYSQVTGKVVSVNYREGQMVRKDQSLIEIDPRPYEAQLKQAEGTLQHDQGLLKQAEIDLTRYQKAVALNAIAHQTLDDQEQIVEQYKGTVKNDEGQVDYQKVQLSYCWHPLRAEWAYAWSTRATPSLPATLMHSWWLHNCSRSPWSSTWRKTIFPRCGRRFFTERACLSTPSTARK
jgi:hypothetical protein